MAVPYTFANSTVSIPLSRLDSNFATPITIGNTAVQLGNTVTTLNNMTLANVTISSGSVSYGNANAVVFTNASNLSTTSTAITFDGTNFTTTGNATAKAIIPSGSTIPSNGMFLPAANTVAISTASTERMRADSSGNVGIGTSTPSTFQGKLVVESDNAGAEAVGLSVVNYSSTAGTAIGIGFAPNTNVDLARITAIRQTVGGATDLAFKAYDGSALTEYMRIFAAGNLGYGTTIGGVNNVSGGNNFVNFAASDTSTTVGASKATVTVINKATTTNNMSQLDFATAYNSTPPYWNTSATVGCIFGARTNTTNYYAAGTLVFMTSYGGAGSGAGEWMRITNAGRAYFNTTVSASGGNDQMSLFYSSNAGSAFSIRDTSAQNGNTFIAFYNGATQCGLITSNGTTTTTYGTSSDYRLKDNAQPIQDALSSVAQLKPVTYTWKDTGKNGQGFIAHEIQQIVPDCVVGEKDAVDENGKPKYQLIDAGSASLIALLTKAIQELEARVKQLEGN